MHEVFVAVADLTRVEDRVDRIGDHWRDHVGVEFERFGRSVRVEFGWVVIGLE